MMGVIKLQLDPKLKSENTSLHGCLGAQAASLRLMPRAQPVPIGVVNKEHEAIGCKLCKTLQIWLCNCECLLFSLLAQTIKENKKIERRNLTHEKIPQMETLCVTVCLAAVLDLFLISQSGIIARLRLQCCNQPRGEIHLPEGRKFDSCKK